MTPRNLVCWMLCGGAYLGLFVLGTAQPIELRRDARGQALAVWLMENAPEQSGAPAELPPPKPLPPPVPRSLTRAEAEELIKVSVCTGFTDELVPRLRGSIRISPWPADSVDGVPRAAGRFGGLPDVPPSFSWPRFQGRPLTHLAQLPLAEVAPHDDAGLLPKTGWLCFFYALQAQPRAEGLHPDDRGAWLVTHFDADPNTLKPAQPPKSTLQFMPYTLRFWHEWMLPDFDEEPNVIVITRGDRSGCGEYYFDLCFALAGRPHETGWHHLLGHSVHADGPMRGACALAASGRPVPAPTAEVPWPLLEVPGAAEWILLLQLDLEPLELVAETPGHSAAAGVNTTGRMSFWVRSADLRERKFDRVWLQRQRIFEPDDDDEGLEEADPADE